MKKETSNNYNVFGFMINPHEMLIVSEDGQKLNQVKVDSDKEAKKKFISDVLNQQLIATLGRTDFSMIWVDDPAGEPGVVEACAKMEQGQADGLLDDTQDDEGIADDGVLGDEAHPEEEDLPEAPPETTTPAGELPAPKFKPTPKSKIIEVECAETCTEAEIKRLARNLQSLKAEALLSAANYREQIKGAEKALFEACNGKSYTQMECTVENDWEAGVRRYIRPDTGEVAKEEQIPFEERQLNLDLPLPEEKPADPIAEPVTETAGNEEQVVDDSALTPQAVAESAPETPEEDDFPPPDETEEMLQETAENVA